MLYFIYCFHYSLLSIFQIPIGSILSWYSPSGLAHFPTAQCTPTSPRAGFVSQAVAFVQKCYLVRLRGLMHVDHPTYLRMWSVAARYLAGAEWRKSHFILDVTG